jgi:hypothetical protein
MFFPRHLGTDMPEVLSYSSDIAGIHNNYLFGCMVRRYNCILIDFFLGYIPSWDSY